MRPFVLGLVLLAGCVVYERRPYAPEPAQAPGPPVQRLLAEEQAVDAAFRLCRDRDLQVHRVESATLDAAGRWHVSLAGYADRAWMLLDGRDGKLLRGRFHRGESAPAPFPQQQPPPPESPPPSSPPPGGELD
jgi:hypothetical protein